MKKRGLLKLVAIGIVLGGTLVTTSINVNAVCRDSNGNIYFVNDDDQKVTGWFYDGEDWYYFDKDGVQLKNTTIEGYDLDSDGKVTKESLQKPHNEAEEEKTEANNKEESKKAHNKQVIENKRNEDPLWKKENDKWTLYDKSGKQIKDKWYAYDLAWLHFDKNGYLNTDTTIDGYMLDEIGLIIKRPKITRHSSDSYKEKNFLWKKENDEWYLYDESGILIKDCWEMNNGVWYCFDKNGKMLKNVTVKDSEYNDCILDLNGALTNRKEPNDDEHICKIENGEYHCYLDDKIYTGWAMRDGKWYYFDNDGEMKKDTTIIENGKKYVLGADGAWLN